MSEQLEALRPTKSYTLMELVKQAGVNVDDWPNYAKGKRSPAANPRYCYNWAFCPPDPIVLNLWQFQLTEEDGVIQRTANMKKLASERTGGQRSRAIHFDQAVHAAFEKLPVRVILLEGRHPENSTVWRATKRLLDDETWTVTSYDPSGEFTVTRGAEAFPFVDQFSLPEDLKPERYTVIAEPFKRNAGVRCRVLARAKGRCELCGERGFEMPDGRTYLETHHIDALGKGGPDTDANVVALCPNDHRQAHFSVKREEIRAALKGIASNRVANKVQRR